MATLPKLQRSSAPGSSEFTVKNTDATHPASMPVGAAACKAENVIMVNL
jgi:hypothetical protein